MQIFTAPETASTEEQTGVIGCLEDQNLVRIFLARSWRGRVAERGVLRMHTHGDGSG